MTARKPAKPKPRKGSSVPAIRELRRNLRLQSGITDCQRMRIESLEHRLDALETRAQFRDASHDEPLSNAGEAIGLHFRILGDAPRAPWWRFWRRR